MSRRIVITLSALLVLLIVAACEGPPPTQFVIEVTREVTREVTVVVVATEVPDGEVVEATEETDGNGIIVDPALSVTDASGEAEAPPATPDAFPTPVQNQIIVAEQTFQRGRMFYLQPAQQIWVMIEDDEDEDRGVWTFHPDTWEEGLPEFDPTIIPPEENLYQPMRGFGKLWRENEAIQAALGWAVETEYGHVTDYEFHAGGEIDSSGEYVRGPGYHLVRSRSGDNFMFNEVNGTWRLVADDE